MMTFDAEANKFHWDKSSKLQKLRPAGHHAKLPLPTKNPSVVLDLYWSRKLRSYITL